LDVFTPKVASTSIDWTVTILVKHVTVHVMFYIDNYNAQKYLNGAETS